MDAQSEVTTTGGESNGFCDVEKGGAEELGIEVVVTGLLDVVCLSPENGLFSPGDFQKILERVAEVRNVMLNEVVQKLADVQDGLNDEQSKYFNLDPVPVDARRESDRLNAEMKYYTRVRAELEKSLPVVGLRPESDQRVKLGDPKINELYQGAVRGGGECVQGLKNNLRGLVENVSKGRGLVNGNSEEDEEKDNDDEVLSKLKLIVEKLMDEVVGRPAEIVEDYLMSQHNKALTVLRSLRQIGLVRGGEESYFFGKSTFENEQVFKDRVVLSPKSPHVIEVVEGMTRILNGDEFRGRKAEDLLNSLTVLMQIKALVEFQKQTSLDVPPGVEPIKMPVVVLFPTNPVKIDLELLNQINTKLGELGLPDDDLHLEVFSKVTKSFGQSGDGGGEKRTDSDYGRQATSGEFVQKKRRFGW